MKRTFLIFTIAVLGISISAQETDNQLTPEEFAAGWELLFDGATLEGWKAYNGDQPQSWTVDNNSIHCKGVKGGDDIMTMETFTDFDLKFTWKIEKEGNSGVIYRVREGKQWRRPYLTGPEYQVFDDDPGKFDKHSTGAMYDVFATSTDKKLNPAMEWNTGRIRVSENLVTHWVNGKIVMQYTMYSDEWFRQVAASKWENQPYFGKSPFGHIDFQNHGSKVWYKNVKIRRL